MWLPSLQALNFLTCTEHIKPLNFTVRASFPRFWSESFTKSTFYTLKPFVLDFGCMSNVKLINSSTGIPFWLKMYENILQETNLFERTWMVRMMRACCGRIFSSATVWTAFQLNKDLNRKHQHHQNKLLYRSLLTKTFFRRKACLVFFGSTFPEGEREGIFGKMDGHAFAL